MHDQLRQELRATQHAVLTGPIETAEDRVNRLQSIDLAGEISSIDFDRLALVIAMRRLDGMSAMRLWESLLARNPHALDGVATAIEQCPESNIPSFRDLTEVLAAARLAAREAAARAGSKTAGDGDDGSPSPRRGIMWATLIAVALCGALATAALIGKDRLWSPNGAWKTEPRRGSDSDTADLDDLTRQMVMIVLEGQVRIDGDLRWIPLSHGSGFPVARDLYMTNRHVVELTAEDREEWLELFDGATIDDLRVRVVGTFGFGELRELPGRTVFKAAQDPRDDLALIEVENVRARPFSFASVPSTLAPVKSIGFPGLAGDFANFLSTNQERMDRLAELSSAQAESDGSADLVSYYSPAGLTPTLYKGDINRLDLPGGYLLTDAMIKSGMSGGPLLDEDNRVVGIITLGHVFVEGFGACIRSDHVCRVIQESVRHGQIDWGDACE